MLLRQGGWNVCGDRETSGGDLSQLYVYLPRGGDRREMINVNNELLGIESTEMGFFGIARLFSDREGQERSVGEGQWSERVGL